MRNLVIEWSPTATHECWDGFFRLLCEMEIQSAKLTSCQGSRSKWVLQAKESVEESDLTTEDCVKNVEELFQGRGVREFILIVENPNKCLLVADCFEETICKTSVDISDKVVRLSLVASEETINEISESIEKLSSQFRVVRIRGYTGTEGSLDMLTQRQQEIIQLAFEGGYYNVPQQTSIKELATVLDLDKSTVWEHLQRAEQKLLAEMINRGVAEKEQQTAKEPSM